MRVKVKVCGITNAEDARMASEAGADAVGMVFAESPRRVDQEAASRIVDALPPFVTPVGVFVDVSADEISSICNVVGIRVVQLSGSESREDVVRLKRDGLGVIKAVQLSPEGAIAGSVEGALGADAVLLDTSVGGLKGGTGVRFDCDVARGLCFDVPVIVAGGLTCDNVAENIRTLTPYGVDVSSGVESSPGKKDRNLVKRFIENAGSIL